MKKLVMRFLELAKADNVDPTGETSNIGEVISKIKSNLVFDEFDIDSEKMSAENLKISPDNLELILRNLLRNSMEHGASKVKLSSKNSEKGFDLIIFDNGQGISQGNKEKIFTAFFTTKREKGGTGLGLDIVKSILISHGGDIRLMDSNQGAKFNLLIPIEYSKAI